MKYPNWETYTDDQRRNAVEDELRLDTHNGTSKDDFMNIIHFLSKQNKRLRGEEKPSGGKMVRLTELNEYGHASIKGVDRNDLVKNLDCVEMYRVGEALDRLMSFEIVGLMAVEVFELKAENERLRRIRASFEASGEVFE